MSRPSPTLRPWLLALALAAAPACGLLDFEHSEPIPERTVPGYNPLSPVLDAFTFFPPMSMDMNLEQELAARDTGPAKAVRLLSLTLAVTDTARSVPTDEDTFDFLNVLRIWIAGQSGSSLPRVKLAELDPVPRGATALDLVVDQGVNLEPYLAEGHVLSSEIAGFPPPDDVSYEGQLTVRVEF